MKRRDFLRAAGGVGAVGAAATAARPVAAQSERPDFGGYLDGVDGGYTDARGQDEVTVQVGADGNQGPNAFSPAGIWVDTGTTVRFEWTGNGRHNVVAEEGPAGLDSGTAVQEAGVNYEYTFEEGGVTTYFCAPHKTLGMKGGVAVGDDVPTVETEDDSGGGGDGGGGGGGASEQPLTLEELESMGVPFQPHFVGIATGLMMAVSLVYTFFLLKYGTSPHASGGND